MNIEVNINPPPAWKFFLTFENSVVGRCPEGWGKRMARCLGAQQQTSAYHLVFCETYNEFTRLEHQQMVFFLNVIWVLSFCLGLFPALSLCKDVCGSLHDLSDRDDVQEVRDREMLLCGWWDRSALAKCPARQLPTASSKGCSEPLPQKCGRICTWAAPWVLGGAGEPFTSSPEINGCPDVSCLSPAGKLGCHWCAEVGQQENNTLEGEEDIQGQCHSCELRSWARWCGRQYPSPSFPSSLATTL